MSDSEVCRSSRYTAMPVAHSGLGSNLSTVEAADGATAAAAAGENSTAAVAVIKSVHFTQRCPKPWLCISAKVSRSSAGGG